MCSIFCFLWYRLKHVPSQMSPTAASCYIFQAVITTESIGMYITMSISQELCCIIAASCRNAVSLAPFIIWQSAYPAFLNKLCPIFITFRSTAIDAIIIAFFNHNLYNLNPLKKFLIVIESSLLLLFPYIHYLLHQKRLFQIFLLLYLIPIQRWCIIWYYKIRCYKCSC